MRFALISDIHANKPALDAVPRDVGARGPLTGIYHLGDLVGYIPWPDEVVATIREAAIPGVAGSRRRHMLRESREALPRPAPAWHDSHTLHGLLASQLHSFG